VSGDSARRRGFQSAALCLDYPDAGWQATVPLVTQAVGSLPGGAAHHLQRFLDWADRTPAEDRTRHYVDTFDLRRRCCLYLTYYAFGDTRKRGMAILRFTHAYRSAGFEPIGEELPDHLAVACEFAARDLPAGQRLLAEHRAGVELLRLALDDAGSPYLAVVDLVRELLPEPAPHDLQRALELARSGPPAEDVGLEPFAPPESIGARR
jgi:nitrate reductase molybdenum cofactor assembly chaperone NarJ/NarW